MPWSWDGSPIPSLISVYCAFADACPSFFLRLLFATTNHIERLDPALSRPGRMDVWVNFTHATKWQAEGIFKCFFPQKPAQEPGSDDDDGLSTPTTEVVNPLETSATLKSRGFKHNIPILTEQEMDELAKRFASSIPEDEFSVSTHFHLFFVPSI